MKETPLPTPNALSRRRFLQQTAGSPPRCCSLGAATRPTRRHRTPAATPTTAPLSAAIGPFTPANAPLGVGRGIHPGRVVWAHDPAVTRWSGKEGAWWTDANLDPAGVAEMLRQSLLALTGASDNAAAWNALFRHYNAASGRGDHGYTPDQKIAVKLNLNVVNAHAYTGLGAFSGPAVARSSANSSRRGSSASLSTYDATDSSRTALWRAVADQNSSSCACRLGRRHGREAFSESPSRSLSGDIQGKPHYLPTSSRSDY